MPAVRSSMRSRSTSQNLNDESRRLWVGSNWVVSSSSRIPRGDALGHLLDFCGARLDFDVLKRVRLSRPARTNGSPFS